MTFAGFRVMLLCLSALPLLAQTAPPQDQPIPLANPHSLEERSGRELLKQRIVETERTLLQLRAADKGRAVPRARTDAQDTEGMLRPKVVNGELTARHPTTAALLKVQGTTLGGHCSATLIGQRTVLTAQHCIDDDDNPARYRVFLQHAGIFAVSSIARAQGYAFPIADLAVLKLARPVRDIRPMPLWTGEVPNGTSGIVVGYGRSGGKRQDYGLKRAGSIRTTACRTHFDNSKLVCWDYWNPTGIPGQSSNTCNSDSGGPLYIAGNGRMVVAGVTSGGALDTCLEGDHSYDVSVPVYSGWILNQLGADTAQPGSGPVVLERESKVSGESGWLSPSQPTRRFDAQLRPTTRLVRVSMHGHDDQVTLFGWSVAFTPTGAKEPLRCEPKTGQWGFCSFDARAKGGLVVVTATRIKGAGQVQITLTELD